MLSSRISTHLAAILAASWLLTSGSLAEAARPVDTNLVLGDSYTILAERSGQREQYQGELVKVNERWLVLRCQEKASHRSWFGFSKVTLAANWSDNEESSEEYVWIPREAAKVKQHAPGAQRGPSAAPHDDAPPTHLLCAVQISRRGKTVWLQGSVEETDGEHLLVAVPRKVETKDKSAMGINSLSGSTKRVETRIDRHTIERGEISVVRVPKFDVTHAHSHSH